MHDDVLYVYVFDNYLFCRLTLTTYFLEKINKRGEGERTSLYADAIAIQKCELDTLQLACYNRRQNSLGQMSLR